MFKFLCLFAVLAAASAKPAIYSPYGYGAYPYSYGAYPYSYGAYPYSAFPAAPVVAPVPAVPAVTAAAVAPSLPHNYPAAVVGPTGHPLDTPEVNHAKALHYQAKFYNAHGIHKRAVYTPYAYSAPYVGAYPYAYGAPSYSYSSQSTHTVHPW